jgi:hypothetical protein
MILVVALMFVVVPSVNFSHEHEALLEHHERAASIQQEQRINKKSQIKSLSAGNAIDLKKLDDENQYLPPTQESS